MSKKNETNPAAEAKEITLQDLANVIGGVEKPGQQEPSDPPPKNSETQKTFGGKKEVDKPRSA